MSDCIKTSPTRKRGLRDHQTSSPRLRVGLVMNLAIQHWPTISRCEGRRRGFSPTLTAVVRAILQCCREADASGREPACWDSESPAIRLAAKNETFASLTATLWGARCSGDAQLPHAPQRVAVKLLTDGRVRHRFRLLWLMWTTMVTLRASSETSIGRLPPFC